MNYLYVAAGPDVSVEDHRLVRKCLAAGEFGLPVREAEMPVIDYAYDAARRQYASISVLERLTGFCPNDGAKLLAITERDLFVPVLTFVFGHAQLGGRVAVCSFARLRQEYYGLPPDQDVFAERAVKEALHETGHLFGLLHCSDRRCAMSLATNVRQIDAKQDGFCALCRRHLGRIKGVNG